ncbi:hypothetical protein TNCV_3115921 [Trichonephila clavipes]|nr:hypothetical protein TNCV_3115921 [Trichonephila clavipes]
MSTIKFKACGSPVVKVSDHGRHVMSSSPVPLKTRSVGQQCPLNLSRAETLVGMERLNIRAASHSEGQVPNQRQNDPIHRQNHHRRVPVCYNVYTSPRKYPRYNKKAEELAKNPELTPNHLTSRPPSTPMQLPAED